MKKKNVCHKNQRVARDLNHRRGEQGKEQKDFRSRAQDGVRP